MTRDPQYPWYDDKPVELIPPTTGGKVVAFGDHMGVDDLDGSGWDYVSYSDIDYDDTGIDRVQLALAKIRTWGETPADTPDAPDFAPVTDTTDTSIAALSVGDDTPRSDRAALHGKQNS